ncbi:hypothetical protein COO60DRAFT_756488 [Scenedesmus sp. NREL 46B-D3]|nr:hypothetical protein COO60DRAFT_756488 [Scenedesmus sp. NREL 46B-D3]
MAPAHACSCHFVLPLKLKAFERHYVGVGATKRSLRAAGAACVNSSTRSSSSSRAGARNQVLGVSQLRPARPSAHRDLPWQARSVTAGISSSKEALHCNAQHGSSTHKPLLQHMQELLLQYQQQYGPIATPNQDLPEQQQRPAQELLHSSSLLLNQKLYYWLNRQLQGLKVRTVMGKPGASVKKHAVAFLDPRSSARIMVTDPCGGSEHVSCFDYNAMKFPGIEAELVRDAAGQPLLPCIGVRLSAGKAAAGSGTGSLEDGFLSYPVEVCW